MTKSTALSAIDEEGRENYLGVADETHSLPSEAPPLTLDDLQPYVVDMAKAFAEKYDLSWPPLDVDRALDEVRTAFARRARLEAQLVDEREARENAVRTRKERQVAGRSKVRGPARRSFDTTYSLDEEDD